MPPNLEHQDTEDMADIPARVTDLLSVVHLMALLDFVVVVASDFMAVVMATIMPALALIMATVDKVPTLDSPTEVKVLATEAMVSVMALTVLAMVADTKSSEGNQLSQPDRTFKADYLSSVVPKLAAAASVKASVSAASAVSAAISSARTSSMTTTELIRRALTRNALALQEDPVDLEALRVVTVPMIINTIIAMAVSIDLTLDAPDKTNLVRESAVRATISTSCLKVCREVLSGRLPPTTSTLVVSRTAHTPLWSLNLTSTSRELLLA